MAEVTSGNLTALLLTPEEVYALCDVLEEHSQTTMNLDPVRKLSELYDALGCTNHATEMEE